MAHLIASQCSALVPCSILCSSDFSFPCCRAVNYPEFLGTLHPFPQFLDITHSTGNATPSTKPSFSFQDLFLSLWGGRRCLSCDLRIQCKLHFSQVTRGRGPYISYKCTHVTRAPAAPACPLGLPAPCLACSLSKAFVTFPAAEVEL